MICCTEPLPKLSVPITTPSRLQGGRAAEALPPLIRMTSGTSGAAVSRWAEKRMALSGSRPSV